MFVSTVSPYLSELAFARCARSIWKLRRLEGTLSRDAPSQNDSPAMGATMKKNHSGHLYFKDDIFPALVVLRSSSSHWNQEEWSTLEPLASIKLSPFSSLLCPYLGELVGVWTRISVCSSCRLGEAGKACCQNMAVGLLFPYTFSSEMGRWPRWTSEPPCVSIQMYSGKYKQSQYMWFLPSGLK